MKNWKKLLKVIPLVFFIFMGNFYYEVEGKSRSSRSKSRSISSTKSSWSKSSSSSRTSKSSSSSSSSSRTSKSSSSKSSSSSSSSSGTNDTSSGRSSLDLNSDKNYAPKESKNIKTQTIDGKKIDSSDIEEVFENGGIDISKTKKYYYPINQRSTILNSSYIKYYIVYNSLNNSVNMVTNRANYSDSQIIGAVYNKNGKEEIVMFEEGRTRSTYFNMANIIIIIIIIIGIWVFISYKRTFSRK